MVLKDEGASDVYEQAVKLRNSLRKMAKKQRRLSVESAESRERFDSFQDEADLQLIVGEYLEKVQQCLQSYQMQVSPQEPSP